MARLRVLGENPPPPRGNGENQLRELRDYLTRLKDELEFLMTHLGEDNLDKNMTEYIRQLGRLQGQADDAAVKIEEMETGKQDADRFLVMDTDYVDLATATWQSWSGGNLLGIVMPVTDLPSGYHPISATIDRYQAWPQGAHFTPAFGYQSGVIYALSDVPQSAVGNAKLAMRVVYEKDVSA